MGMFLVIRQLGNVPIRQWAERAKVGEFGGQFANWSICQFAKGGTSGAALHGAMMSSCSGGVTFTLEWAA
jgi:hypothetical protein